LNPPCENGQINHYRNNENNRQTIKTSKKAQR
jgi:hypothetical protein